MSRPSSVVVVVVVFVMFVLCVSSVRCSVGLNRFRGLADARDRDLSNLTNQVLSRYFFKFRCFTYIVDDAYEDVFPLETNRPVILVNFTNSASTFGILRQAHEESCGGFVVRIKSTRIRTLMDQLVAVKRRAVCCRYNNQKYLFLLGRETSVRFSFMTHGNLTYFPNSVFFAETKDKSRGGRSFAAFGHTMFDCHKHDVLNVTREVLDYWTPERGFEYENNLFPDRLENVMGRKFRFAALQYPPFNMALNESGRTIFDGFETRIAAHFVDMINGTWDAVNYDDLWGEVFKNGTGTGVVGAILAERADFGFAGVYQWFCEDVDCIKPYYQSRITCLVPRPRLLSEWLTIVLPFTVSTWVALMIANLVNTIVFLLLLLEMKHLTGLRTLEQMWFSLGRSIFTIFRIQLGQIPKIKRFQQPLAVYIRVMVLFYYIVAVFWQGGIASSLTIPRYEEPIDTTTDLIQRWPKVQWGADSNAWILSIRASSDPNLVQIVQKFLILDNETLYRKTKTEDFGFFIEELPHGHYGFSEYIQEESLKYLRIMRKTIYTAFGVIVLPKGSPFTEKLDGIVLRMYDTGIIHKMEVQAILDRINNKLQHMIRSSNEKPRNTVKLAVRHIQGPLYIYSGGVLLALIVFIFELLTHFTTKCSPLL